MDKVAYTKGSEASKRAKREPRFPAEKTDLFSGANSIELELLRQELRTRSDGLRNTTLRETAPNKLPGGSENEQYTARIDTEDQTIHLGADKEEQSLLAAANPRGQENVHREEHYTYSSPSGRYEVSSAIPKQRDEFTLSDHRFNDSSFINTAAQDKDLERSGDGQIRRTAERITSVGDRQTADEIKNMEGLSPAEEADISKLGDLAQSVRQRSEALEKAAEQQTQKIINHITAHENSGDDFFDFLHRRSDEEEQPERFGGGEDTETEGTAHEKDNQTGA